MNQMAFLTANAQYLTTIIKKNIKLTVNVCVLYNTDLFQYRFRFKIKCKKFKWKIMVSQTKIGGFIKNSKSTLVLKCKFRKHAY